MDNPNKALKKMTPEEREAWSQRLMKQLLINSEKVVPPTGPPLRKKPLSEIEKVNTKNQKGENQN